MEGSAISLLSETSKGSHIFTNINKYTDRRIETEHQSARESLIRLQQTKDDIIYIKRHLLKTRGLSGLTRSINEETSTAIRLMNTIERKRNSKEFEKMAKVNLSKKIRQTTKK